MPHDEDPDELIGLPPLPRMHGSSNPVYLAQRVTILELRKRIEELEGKVSQFSDERRTEWIRSENAEAERDSLRAQVGRLAEAIRRYLNWHSGNIPQEGDECDCPLCDNACAALTPDSAALGQAWKALMEEHEALGVARNRSICNCNACMKWKTAEAALKKAGMK